VKVTQEGTADPPVEGWLAAESVDGFAVTRTDPRAGEVAVHFPREGQILSAA
jgi:hypothetical protein